MPLQEILSELATADAAATPLTLRLCRSAVARLQVTGAGVSLMAGGVPSAVLATTDVTALHLADSQFSLGEGPCIEASARSSPVLQPDLLTTGKARWPVYTNVASEAGVNAAFSFPLTVGAIALGVLDLYRTTAGPLTDEQLSEALCYADAGALILLQEGAEGSGVRLEELPAHRAEVHQATGMVTVQMNVTMAQALALLRARAFATNRPLIELAIDVVARRVRIEEETP